MFGKWIHYAESFQVCDILTSAPSTYWSKYAEVHPSDKVKLDPKFHQMEADVLFVSAATAARSGETRHKMKKIASTSKHVKYMLKSTKSVGCGRKVKYGEQEEFIVEAVVIAWETGKPLSKSDCYNILIHQFGHTEETEQIWEENENLFRENLSSIITMAVLSSGKA